MEFEGFIQSIDLDPVLRFSKRGVVGDGRIMLKKEKTAKDSGKH